MIVLALFLRGTPQGLDAPIGPPWQPLPDLSGLAWVEGATFLAVHDAKAPDEPTAPRVSLIETPGNGERTRWEPVRVAWPDGSGPSHDLESLARVPGTSTYLLLESGDGGTRYRRIFVAALEGRTMRITEVAEWPLEIFDVEGVAVARAGGQLYFVFAERAHGRRSTRIVWAPLSLAPWRLGRVREAEVATPVPAGPDVRPVSALEIDGEGVLWTASTYDPGDDGGPFRSVIWRIGRLGTGPEGQGQVHLLERPHGIATLDGLKVESLAVQVVDGETRLFLGTDDENYGGVIRWVPLERGAEP